MSYEAGVRAELEKWKVAMARKPSMLNKLSKGMQDRVNRIIPEKIHAVLTTAIKQMIRAVLFGATHTMRETRQFESFSERETAVMERINFYKKATAAEGGITGAGGLLLGLADFPIFLSMKIKMLFEIAALYGYDIRDYRERVYILHIFQLAFSAQERRREVFLAVTDWEAKKASLPPNMDDFEWRTFQQQYRDYIDLVKLAQLVPGIGAVVGFVANYQLTQKLGNTAMNAYRMRLLPPQ